ncbi:MAG: hypothetical protein KA152_15255 [Verrucomicrobiales bacterium]|nr:hypothetical protein [Verrucomicrobiales bacterium]
MNIRHLCFAIIAMGLVRIEAQDPVRFESQPYQYQREIVGTPDGEGLGSLLLDPEIYRHSGPSHSKLRLVKRDGENFVELPWVVEPVEKARAGEGEQRIPHTIESFEEAGDGSIELTVVLAEGLTPPARMEILTPLKDFEKSVTVSSSTDGITWSPLVSDGLIFDYERFLDFRRTSLDLPESKSRRFRVRISSATDQQRSLVKELSRSLSDSSGVTISESEVVETRIFRMDEIRFFTASKKRDRSGHEETSKLKILEQKPNPESRTTEILVDGGGIPIHEITLTTADRNFRREVSVQIPNKSTPGGWETIHRGRVHCYRVGDFHDESLSFRFNEVRSDHYRIVIENLDSPPLTIQSVTATGDLYELLFLAGEGDQCSIFVGSPVESMTTPQFDTAAIIAAKNQKVKRERFTFGPLTGNPGFSAAPPPDQRLFESKGLLWVAIASVVALLIFVLYRALQRVEAIEEEN